MTIRVSIIGAAGRMGRLTSAAILATEDFALVSAIDPQATELALPEAVIATSDPKAGLVTPEPRIDVAIDFSAPSACGALLPLCAEHEVAYLVAGTALSAEDQAAVAAAAARIPVVVASNCSIGVNLLAELVELAAGRLGSAFDIEISELHHRHKRDAPSGTALTLADAARAGRTELTHRLGRAGHEPERDPAQLGIAALRGGDVSGEHTVFFLGTGERLELTHRATSRQIFADGALRAARWLVGRAKGCYGMRDVLAG